MWGAGLASSVVGWWGLRRGSSSIPLISQAAIEAEQRVFRDVQRPLYFRWIPIARECIDGIACHDTDSPLTMHCVDTCNMSGDLDHSRPVIILLHGWGGGSGLFVKQMDALATKYRVIAVDMLGWGLSSRPEFRGKTSRSAQQWFVRSFEEFRRSMNISRFALVGHSLGGFVACSYALEYTDRVSHLFLETPVGLRTPSKKPSDTEKVSNGESLNEENDEESQWSPQSIVRALGPTMGSALVGLVRSQDRKRFGFDDDRIIEYLYHISALPPSGETAWGKLFPKNGVWGLPLEPELSRLAHIPVTFVYGERDPLVDYSFAEKIIRLLPNSKIHIIPDVGHHPHVEVTETFNDILLNSLEISEK